MEKYPPFIYEPVKSMEVLEKTELFFKNHSNTKQRIENSGWIYQSIGKVIPQTAENLFSGHFFPYVESWDELQISFNLAIFGFYKQAFMSLRSVLELGMLSVYYNINDDGHKTVQDWLKSKDAWEANTPRVDKIWKILRSNKNIMSFDEKFGLRKSFNDLSVLHNYVHTKGYEFSNKLGLPKSNCQTFEEDVLEKWINTYERVIILVITLHMLKYPISVIEFEWSEKIGIDNPFPVLESFEIKEIETFLPREYFEEIKKIADNDQGTQDFCKYIRELPDMTEEEQEFQIIKFDKSRIEHGEGFEKWEKQEIKLIERCSDGMKKKILDRIEILRKWAIENNMMKSKVERLGGQGFFKNNK
ncbi:MAG: hypothetical protein PHH49_06095 [Candidatus Omnitrophica bacterium]|nr:hypothetical protein [Candidatus Omnitrophota bacterium]MDD5488512.1 hypothetical protein [Candidatus Omnitrophota bacterium]